MPFIISPRESVKISREEFDAQKDFLEITLTDGMIVWLAMRSTSGLGIDKILNTPELIATLTVAGDKADKKYAKWWNDNMLEIMTSPIFVPFSSVESRRMKHYNLNFEVTGKLDIGSPLIVEFQHNYGHVSEVRTTSQWRSAAIASGGIKGKSIDDYRASRPAL